MWMWKLVEYKYFLFLNQFFQSLTDFFLILQEALEYLLTLIEKN